MSARNPIGAPQPLDPKLLEQLSQQVESLRKDEVTVYRGHERLSLISFAAPARGRLTRQAMKRLGDCAERRGHDSRYPAALRARKGAVAGYALFEPLTTYDQHAPDQYPIRWSKGYRQAHVDLLPILQPRNLQVPKGYVAEMPLSLEDLPNGLGWHLILHLLESHVRAVKEIPKEEEADFTNDEENGKEQEKPKKGAAAGTQR